MTEEIIDEVEIAIDEVEIAKANRSIKSKERYAEFKKNKPEKYEERLAERREYFKGWYGIEKDGQEYPSRDRNLKRKADAEKAMSDTILNKIWKAENRDYINCYVRSRRKGLMLTKKLYVAWMSKSEDERRLILEKYPDAPAVERGDTVLRRKFK